MTPFASVYYSVLSLAQLPNGISSSPTAPTPPSRPWPRPSSSSSSCLFAMTQASRSFSHVDRTRLPISPTTSMNGGDAVASAKSNSMTGSSSIGSLSHSFRSLLRMWQLNDPSRRKRLSLKPSSLTSSMPSPDIFTPSYQTPLEAIPRITMHRGHPTLPMASLAVSLRSFSPFL